MAENKTSWVFDLDVKDASDKLLKIQGAVDKLGQEGSLQGLMKGLLEMAPVIGIVSAAVYALKIAFDLTKEGEQLNSINAQFEILAKNAGIAGDVMKEKLVAATAGMAVESDVLKSANEQMVKLGVNAQKLPEVMELARKVTKVFGGDLIENFEGISTGIANGNLRMLKRYGILIDTEKAMLNYAKSIGTTVSSLSEEGRQLAIMNAALEKGQTAFKDIDKASKPLSKSLTEIKVAISETYEAFAVFVNKNSFIQSSFKVLAQMIKGTANSLKQELSYGADASDAKIQNLNKQLKELETNLSNVKSGNESWMSKIFGGADTELIQKRIDDIKTKIAEASAEKEKLQASEPKREVATEKQAATTGIDLEKQRAQRTEFEKSLADMNRKSLELYEQNAMSIEEADKLHNDRRLMIEQEFANQRNQLEQMVQQGKMTRSQADMMEVQLDEQKKQKLIMHDHELEQKRMDALKRYADRNKETAEGFKGSWAAATAQAGLNAKNFSNLGTTAFTSLKTNGVAMFKALGDGSKSAGDAMKGFMFNSLADIAEAQGQELLAFGIGSFNPVPIAQGGALIALSSMLRSQAGGGGGGGLSASGGGGGGGGGYAGAPESALPESKPTVQEPKKAVSINIHGSYYETEQTKTRLMEMIREVSDATDFSFKQIGQ